MSEWDRIDAWSEIGGRGCGWDQWWIVDGMGWNGMRCDMNSKGILNDNIWTEMGRKKLNKAYFVHNNPTVFYIFRTRTFLKEM